MTYPLLTTLRGWNQHQASGDAETHQWQSRGKGNLLFTIRCTGNNKAKAKTGWLAHLLEPAHYKPQYRLLLSNSSSCIVHIYRSKPLSWGVHTQQKQNWQSGVTGLTVLTGTLPFLFFHCLHLGLPTASPLLSPPGHQWRSLWLWFSLTCDAIPKVLCSGRKSLQ